MKGNPAKPSQPKRWLHPNVVGFGLASLFSDLGHELVTSLLPGFLLSIGAPAYALGLLEAISNGLQSAAKVWGGRTASRTRHLLPWLYVGYFATGLKALIALAGTWPMVILIRTAGWIGRGLRGPIRDYTISRSVDPSAYGRAFGLREALDTIGALLGPVLAFVLLPRLGYRPLIAWTAVPGVLALLAVVLLVRAVPRLSSQEDVRQDAQSYTYSAFLRHVRSFALFSISYVSPTFFILLALQSLGRPQDLATGALAVGLYVLHNLVYAVAAYPLGALGDRLGPVRALRLGYVVWGVALAVFALAGRTPALLPLGFVLSGLGTATIEGLQSAAVSRLLPDAARGGGLGLVGGITGIGNLVANLVAGFVFSLHLAPVLFVALGLLAVTAAWTLRTTPPHASAR